MVPADRVLVLAMSEKRVAVMVTIKGFLKI